MTDIHEQIRRRQLRDNLLANYEGTIELRVERYLEITHNPIIPNHHFSQASAECISLYSDGYFLSAVMVTQAVVEGIRNFIVERNKIKPDENMDGRALVGLLAKNGIISQEIADAFDRVWNSFRNDVHHMNPKVAEIPFREIAKRNIQDLAAIECEVFEHEIRNGRIIPLNPKYWAVEANGTMPVFLRLEP